MILLLYKNFKKTYPYNFMITDNFSRTINEKSYSKHRHYYTENYENYFYMIRLFFLSILWNQKKNFIKKCSKNK